MPRAPVRPSAAAAAAAAAAADRAALEPSDAELARREDEMNQFVEAVVKAQEAGGAASIGAMTLDVLLELVDDQIYSVIFETHRAYKLKLRSTAEVVVPGMKFEGLVDIIGFDIFGNNPERSPVEAFKCPHCGTLRQPAKFAPHLEKCMGMGGRELRRGAMRGNGKPEPVPAAATTAVKRKGMAPGVEGNAAKVARVDQTSATATDGTL